MGKRWSVEEDQTLINNYSHIPSKDLRRLLPNRSINSIYLRASNYKLKQFIENPLDRFICKINKNSGTFGYDGKYPSECWIWTANTNEDGYGLLWMPEGNIGAHVFSYKLYHGDIPLGMTVNHICYVRNCVNPTHLNLLSVCNNILDGQGPAAINARKQHCKHGHALTIDNTYKQPNGRGCLICRRIYGKIWQEKLRRNRGMIDRRWSDEEKQFLVANWANTPKPEIQKLIFKRSWKSIQGMAHILKLKRSRGL